MQSGATKVVFRATDGFSSSLTIDKAIHPTTLLALKVNETTLSDTQPLVGDLPAGYPYKVVAPCKHGYKWVGWIREIEVVNYDYKGTYESQEVSDDASMPNCIELSEIQPPYTTLNATSQANLNATIFSDGIINKVDFNQTKGHIELSVTTEDQNGFAYLIVPKKLLFPAFLVFSDGTPTQCNTTQSQTNSFIYFAMGPGTHQDEIRGALPADVTGPKTVSDGKVDLRDIGYVARRFLSTPRDLLWDPRVDLNFDNKVDMQDIAIIAGDFGLEY